MTQFELVVAVAGTLFLGVALLALIPDRGRIEDQRLAAELSARWKANDPAVKRWARRPLLLRILLPWP